LHKKNLSDEYIVKYLNRKSSIKGVNIPPEVIELSRASLRLKNMVKKAKANIKHCRYHGDLTLEQVILNGKRHNEQNYKCKACAQAQRSKFYQTHKKEVAIKCRAYKKRKRETQIKEFFHQEQKNTEQIDFKN